MAKVQKSRVEYYEEEIPRTLKEFETWEFTSGITTGEDFNVFARKFQAYLAQNLPEGASILNFSRGHYDCSGFVQSRNKYVYFAISDVRHFPGDWTNNILIRTAESAKDFTGGRNHYTTLEKFGQDVGRMLGLRIKQKRLI